MNASDRVLVIVPAWNEVRSIGTTVAEIIAASPSYDVIVVDDGSTDGTRDAAREAGAKVLVLPFNLGVGGAMKTGYTYAQRHGYGRAIQVDADGQHNPVEIANVIAGLADADISIGARYADVGEYDLRGPRRWAQLFLASVVSKVAKTKLTDVTSGFRAANVRAVDQYVRYYPAEWLGDTIDSLVAACHAGLTVTQVPVAMRPRTHGTSSQGAIRASFYLLRAVFSLMLAVMRRPVPAPSMAQSEPPS